MPKKILTKEERREISLKTAIKLAKKVGAQRVSLAAVAAEHGHTAPLLSHIFGTHAEFVKAIVKQAKKEGVMLPEAAPTVRAIRAERSKTAPKAKQIKLKAPVRKATPIKLKPPVKAPAAKKVVAAKKAAPTKKVVAAKKAAPTKKVVSRTGVAPKATKKSVPATPPAPKSKFPPLPTPFEASIAAVAPELAQAAA